MNETSLSLLARLHRSTDSMAWNRLVDLYTPLLHRWLRQYQVQPADADDLLQEVLAVVAQELPRFEHNQRTGAFRSWLRKILVNRLRNFWRAREYRLTAAGGTSMREQLAQLEDPTSQLSRLWDEEHDRHVIAQLLKQIRPRFLPKTWEAFRRQMFAAERADQVALELDMPLSSVYVARSRVLAALRREATDLVDSV